MSSPFDTHAITNQVPPFEGTNLFGTDTALMEAVSREGGGAARSELAAFGESCGSVANADLARIANEATPRLKTHDAKGHRLDTVDYHPAYHVLMRISTAAGLHCRVWEHQAVPGAIPVAGRNVVRAATLYLAAQMEAGHCCPLTMTHAAVPTLSLEPSLAGTWMPKLLSRSYDPSFLPAAQKTAVTIGMGLTEKQGGTDVRANTTIAEPRGAPGPGAVYTLTGHKWFMSAPMSDAFLVLAQARGGLSCFLLPRWREDGTVNGLRFQRLKEKLGNRSNASSEVEFHAAEATLIGEEGRGVAGIIEMVTETRLDCAVSSAGLMRQALARAIHHARHRTVFQKALVDQVVMTEVLADMALDVEAATALVFRLARAFDHAGDPRAAAWRRLMTPVVKYWVTKLAPAVVCEAMECLGGNGYVEDEPLARLYREVPVNAIWEGSGNVMALDVLRVLQREPDVADMVLEDLAVSVGTDPYLLAGLERIQALLHEPRLLDRRARTLVETLAVVSAGAILKAHAPAGIADPFIISRLSAHRRQSYGQGIDWANAKAIVDRALPPMA
ncbi:MAG: isovaleryl-CoA dehydrogenase [Hyphomicrobiaceae bacterium]